MRDLTRALLDGRCVLWATDTVYGLAALPATEGYHDIFRLKRREESQTLPWLVADAAALDTYGTCVPAYAYNLSKLWPGGLTLVVKASQAALELGGVAADGTVALRVPNEPTCLAVLSELGAPVACTSANLHGRPAPCALSDVDRSFAALPHDEAIPRRCSGGVSSTIVDCTGPTPRILREGPISAEQIRALAR